MATASEAAGTPVRLWDLPVRIVHWLFVLLLPALWWTAHHDELGLHKKFGMAMLILVVFRILWGLVGSSTARFSSFVRGPRAVWGYARTLFSKDAGDRAIGHNPLGGWSVVLLLLLLAVQVGLGLITQDSEALEMGPLNSLVSYDTAEWARGMHELGFDLILAAAAIHVVAILFYLLVKRDNLVNPMLSGRRRFAADLTAPRMAPWWRALVCLFIAWAFGGWIWAGAPLP